MTTNFFHDLATKYDQDRAEWRRRHPHNKKLQRLTPAEYYTSFLRMVYRNQKSVQNFNLNMTLAMVETSWIKCNRPYYRIYPDYVEIFRKSSLDLPIRQFQTPYRVQAVRFQSGAEPVIAGLGKVRAFLVSAASLRELSIDYLGSGMAESVMAEAGVGETFNDKVVSIIAHAEQPDGSVVAPSFALRWLNEAGDTHISEVLKSDTVLSGEFGTSVGDLWRIALSVCYLARHDDLLIEPDVVNSEFASYLAAVNAKRWDDARHIAAASTKCRSGQPGFTVGRREALLGRHADDRADCDIGTGRGLVYSHERKSHPRRIWNADRSSFRVVEVSQTTVRRDLPPDPRRRGERTLESKAEERQILNSEGSQQ